MIAIKGFPEKTDDSPRMRGARRRLLSVFMHDEESKLTRLPLMSAGKSWTMALWAIAVACAYGMMLVRLM